MAKKSKLCCFCEENHVSPGFDYCSKCNTLYSELDAKWYLQEWAQATIKSERKHQYQQSKAGEIKLSKESVREAVIARYGIDHVDDRQMQQMIEIDVAYGLGVYYSVGATIRNTDGTFARKVDFDARIIELLKSEPGIGGKRVHSVLTSENETAIISLSTVHRRLRELRKAV